MHRAPQQVLHAVEVSLHPGPGGIDHIFQVASHKDIGEAGYDGPHGLLEVSRGLAVNVDAVDVLGGVDGPQEPLKHLDFVVDDHGVGNGELCLLLAQRELNEPPGLPEFAAVLCHVQVLTWRQGGPFVRSLYIAELGLLDGFLIPMDDPRAVDPPAGGELQCPV